MTLVWWHWMILGYVLGVASVIIYQRIIVPKFKAFVKWRKKNKGKFVLIVIGTLLFLILIGLLVLSYFEYIKYN